MKIKIPIKSFLVGMPQGLLRLSSAMWAPAKQTMPLWHAFLRFIGLEYGLEICTIRDICVKLALRSMVNPDYITLFMMY